jgi:acyl-CoA carboxylase subunit beta
MTPGSLTAREVLAAVLDAGSFRSWDTAVADAGGGPAGGGPGAAYAAELAAARARTGVDESVITGEGRIGGHPVAVAASEFGFLGGSIGLAAGERLTRAVERATAARLPLITLPASGGTRMQEGTLAFLQMVKITGAVTAHRRARLPYLVYLRHPSTGGVFASWASVGHLTLAQPGALIGFLGPRVYEALAGRAFPAGIQTAENLAAHGLVDAVIAPDRLGGLVARVLDALTPASEADVAAGAGVALEVDEFDGTGVAAAGANVAAESGGTEVGEAEGGGAWASVLRTRQPDYPDARALIAAAATDVVTLREDSVILALARIGGSPVVLAAQDRHAPPPGPGALRVARRGVRLAADLGLPLVTVIDTAGGELSPQAEQDGLAAQIAHTLSDLLTTPSATVSVLLGQGTGGAALALLPADRTVAAADGWLAPLAPEGASAIMYRDTDHAADLAGQQGIRAADLAAAGVVDEVITGTGQWTQDLATQDPAQDLVQGLGRAVHRALAELARQNPERRLAARTRRYRGLGQ